MLSNRDTFSKFHPVENSVTEAPAVFLFTALTPCQIEKMTLQLSVFLYPPKSFQMDYAFGSRRVGPWLDTIQHLKAYTPLESLLCRTVKGLRREMEMGLRMGEGKAGHLFAQRMRRSESVS